MQLWHNTESTIDILLYTVMTEYISQDCCDEHGGFEQRIQVVIADLSRETKEFTNTSQGGGGVVRGRENSLRIQGNGLTASVRGVFSRL